MKIKTESAAWLYLARCWDKVKPPFHNQFPKAFVADREHDGLCGCLETLDGAGMISGETFRLMIERIRKEIPANVRESTYYLFPLTKAGAKKRAALCRRFAKEARGK